MDIRKVKKLIEMMEESDISEIEIKEGDDSVRISRGGLGVPVSEVKLPEHNVMVDRLNGGYFLLSTFAIIASVCRGRRRGGGRGDTLYH